MAKPSLPMVTVSVRIAATFGDTPDDVDRDADAAWCDSGIVTLTPLLRNAKAQTPDGRWFGIGKADQTLTVGPGGWARWNHDSPATDDADPNFATFDLTSEALKPHITTGAATHVVKFDSLSARGVRVKYPDINVRLAPENADPVTGVIDVMKLAEAGPPAVVQVIEVTDANIDARIAAGLDTKTATLVSTPGTALEGSVGAKIATSGSAFYDISNRPGVDPTGVTECAAAIQTALDAAAAFGFRAYAKGVFKIASTVTIANHADLGDATFRYIGASGTAVLVGTATSGAFVTGKRIVCPQVIATAKTQIGWAQVAGTIGIDICNILASVIEVPMIRSFETGMRNYGKGKGNVHNTVMLGHLDNNKVNQLLAADAGGWTNQNLYLGGQFSHNSGEGTNVAGVQHIEMAVTANPVNNNLWLNPSLEGNISEFAAIISGSVNVIDNGRWEVTGGARVKWASDASGNDIRGGYKANAIIETFASGALGSNNVNSSGGMYRTASAATKGVLVLENQTSSANPAVVVMGSGARVAQKNPATAYCTYFGAQYSGFKRETDNFDRIRIDGDLGRVYFGVGTAAPGVYLGPVSTSGLALKGGNLYFDADNTYDIGLDASTLRPRDGFFGRDVRAGRVLKSGAVATGARPTAAVAGAGGMIFDTTLGKPIWSNGTNWVDATGTTV